MRPLLLSLGLLAAGLGIASAQGASGLGGGPQIAVGQTYKNFMFPMYQNGQLSYTIYSVSATGVTLNRAETTDLKIQLYTNGKVTTTITSPKADIYIADRVMRTKNTVLIDRADLRATAQSCDFDLISKKYFLRQNVRVLLKNFDVGAKSRPPAPIKTATGSTPISPVPAAVIPDGAVAPLNPNATKTDATLETPGGVSSTNIAPAPAPTVVTP